jgi:uncharacterized protein (DUF433 family)
VLEDANMVTATEALVQKSPNVIGGDACIRGTRIAVWMLVDAWRLGFTDDELLNHYVVPLTHEDLAAARAYYGVNKEEIDTAILRNDEA